SMSGLLGSGNDQAVRLGESNRIQVSVAIHRRLAGEGPRYQNRSRSKVKEKHASRRLDDTHIVSTSFLGGPLQRKKCWLRMTRSNLDPDSSLSMGSSPNSSERTVFKNTLTVTPLRLAFRTVGALRSPTAVTASPAPSRPVVPNFFYVSI